MARRHQQLEDSLKLHQFRHDAEDEVSWIRERNPLASSSDLGRSLTEVQNLQKKHRVLETELSSHVAVIEGVASMAQELIAARHFASQQIEEQQSSLLELWASLKGMVAKRSQMLSDSLHVQQVNHAQHIPSHDPSITEMLQMYKLLLKLCSSESVQLPNVLYTAEPYMSIKLRVGKNDCFLETVRLES